MTDNRFEADAEDFEIAEAVEKAEQPRNLRGKFTADPGESFLPDMVSGIPGVKAKIDHTVTELVTEPVELIDPEDDLELVERVTAKMAEAMADEPCDPPMIDMTNSAGLKKVTKIAFQFDEFGAIVGLTKTEGE